MREDTIVRRFGAEFRRDGSYVSALSLMAPVFELPLSDVTVVDGEKAVFECRVTATPAAEVAWYVDNVEIRQTDDYQVVFTADGWCRLIIRDVMPGLSTKRAPASVQPTSPFYRQLQGRGRQRS